MGVDENADGCGRGANGGGAPKVGRACAGEDTGYAANRDLNTVQLPMNTTYLPNVQLWKLILKLLNLIIACDLHFGLSQWTLEIIK